MNKNETPGIARRLASMLYDSMLLAALLFIAGFLFVAFTQGAMTPLIKWLLRAYLLGVAGLYFIWLWLHGGQTLAMKTWHLRIVDLAGQPIDLKRAALRYALAVPSVLFGIGLLWALFDRDRQFLHDRLAKTRIIRVK